MKIYLVCLLKTEGSPKYGFENAWPFTSEAAAKKFIQEEAAEGGISKKWFTVYERELDNG